MRDERFFLPGNRSYGTACDFQIKTAEKLPSEICSHKGENVKTPIPLMGESKGTVLNWQVAEASMYRKLSRLMLESVQ